MHLDVRGVRVLVSVVPEGSESNTTTGGIVLLGANTPNQQEALVEAIGQEVKYLEFGDRILIRKPSGVPVEFGGEKYLLLNETDILAVIKQK